MLSCCFLYSHSFISYQYDLSQHPKYHALYYSPIKRFKKICKADLRQTRRRTQAGLTPGKDENDVWHKVDRKDIIGFLVIGSFAFEGVFYSEQKRFSFAVGAMPSKGMAYRSE